MASSSSRPISSDAPRMEIPLHSLPTKSEVLKQFYNEDNNYESVLKHEAFERNDKAANEPSKITFDTSLFPYQAEGHIDPPLPTLSEICAARPAFKEIENGRNWRVGSYMIKAGSAISILQEAENLLYLERNSTVRTPKVYAAFASDKASANPFNWPDSIPDEQAIFYIIMEYIDGSTVRELKSEVQNKAIRYPLFEKIGEQLRRLRAVQPEDPTHFGRIGGRPYPHLIPFYHPPGSSDKPHGPFTSYEECVTRLIHSAKVSQALSIATDDYYPLQRFTFRDAPSILLDFPKPIDRLPVLSHMDLQDHNMMAKVKRDDAGNIIEVEEVVLIDWATMCWMPSWFEPGDLCYLLTDGNDPHYGRMAQMLLETMGYVNTAIVFFFGLSAHTCFPLEHL